MKEYIRARDAKDLAMSKKILDALLDVIIIRAERGILNRDRSFLRNFGFDGEKAYQIDIGSFFKNPEMNLDASFQKSARDSLDPVEEWLSENDPEMLPYFKKKLDLNL